MTGICLHGLEKAPTTNNINVFSLLGGKSVIKSILIVDQGLAGVSTDYNPGGSPPHETPFSAACHSS